jgi:hypothetical protein
MRRRSRVEESAMPRLVRHAFVAIALFASAVAAPFPSLAAGQVAGRAAMPPPPMRPNAAFAPAFQDRMGYRHAGRHDPRHVRFIDAHGRQRPGFHQGRKAFVTVGGGLWLPPFRSGQVVFVVEPPLVEPIALTRRIRDVTELPVAIGIRRAPEAQPEVIRVR